MNGRLRLVTFSAAVAVAAGCTCGPRANSRFPTIQVLDAAGNERTSVEFGLVQLNRTAEQRVRVRNSGTAVLNLSSAQLTNRLFAVTNLPLALDSNGEAELVVTFRPTQVGVRATGTLTLATDDPQHASVVLDLGGAGIAAAAVLVVEGLDAGVATDTLTFGDVYVGEQLTLTVRLTNAGTADLRVVDAGFTSDVPAQVTANLAPLLAGPIKGGELVRAQVTFAPTAIPTPLAGALELSLGNNLGVLSVPVRGRATQARPRLCFRWDDAAAERCTDQFTTSITDTAGPHCDATLYPPPADGGESPCRSPDGGAVGYLRGGRLSVRNEGNAPISYTVRFETQRGGQCDGGSGPADLEFANAPSLPDGGHPSVWTEPTVRLPVNAADPMPWQAAPVALTYRARSRCLNDASDQAFVIWTRQGEAPGSTRMPQVLIFTVDGTSMLPRGVSHDDGCSIGAGSPVLECEMSFVGIANAGTAPLTVTQVTLWQGADGGLGPTPAEPCLPGTVGSCQLFSFAPGADPNLLLPLTLAGVVDGGAPVSQVLGRLAFGDAGVVPPLGVHTVFAVIQTDYPYIPKVVATFRGER